MMRQAVCMPNFEILPSFFHFHFTVFVDDHGCMQCHTRGCCCKMGGRLQGVFGVHGV